MRNSRGSIHGSLTDMTPPVTMIGGAPIREQMRTTLRATADKFLYWCRQFAFITGYLAVLNVWLRSIYIWGIMTFGMRWLVDVLPGRQCRRRSELKRKIIV